MSSKLIMFSSLSKEKWQGRRFKPFSFTCYLYNYIDVYKPADLALWCDVLVAFYCLFRKANVAPKSLATFDPIKELSRKKAVH